MSGRRIWIWPAPKFENCGTCANRDEEYVCRDCHNELGYELDQSQIHLDADGELRLRSALD